MSSFTPATGWTVAVNCGADQVDRLVDELRQRGLDPIVFPCAAPSLPGRPSDSKPASAERVPPVETPTDRAAGLLESEGRFQAIFANSLDGIVLRGPDGGIVAANRAACEMLRRTEAELRGLGRAPIVDASDSRFSAALEQHLRAGNFLGELTLVRGDGTRFPAELSSAIFRLADGTERTSMVFRDVTSRKQAEEALNDAEVRFHKAFHNSPDGITINRIRDGLYVAVNPGTAALLGYGEEELIGRTSLDLGIWVDRQERDALVAKLGRDGEVLNFEGRFRRKDGTERIGLVSASVITLDGVPHMLSTTRDITERKHAEQALIEANDLLVNLARLVPGVIYQYRLYADGRSAFPYSSPGMHDIYEVTPEDVREDATPVFGRLHPEDAAYVAEAIEHSAKTLETFYCEFRVVLPRQGLRWRWSQAHPVRTPDGGTLWHGIILDVTDRKLAEAEKETLEAQLQQAQKMESVGRLAGGVAHDFNNMLGVILGHAELAMDQVPTSTALRSDLEEIRKAASRSADLTRQLLAFARKQTVTPRVLDLNDTVAGMVAMLERLIGEDIRLQWSPTPDLWPVKIDPSQIDQLLANLCVNARDAISGVGRVTIRMDNVRLAAPDLPSEGSPAGDFVRIAVTDDGCGMDEETLAHLFEPFFTTKSTGRGTGLGLATVYGIVKQNSGFVRVDSARGRGTTMAIHLPRDLGVAQRAAARADATRVTGGNETLLLVEDEPGVLSMATIVLERLGYTILGARSTEEALRVAADHAADIRLLITDVIMPDMNGRDLAARITSRHPHIKYMFMSGYTADVIARQGLLDDGLTFIQKPFSREALAVKVREALDRPSFLS